VGGLDGVAGSNCVRRWPSTSLAFPFAPLGHRARRSGRRSTAAVARGRCVWLSCAAALPFEVLGSLRRATLLGSDTCRAMAHRFVRDECTSINRGDERGDETI